MTFLTGLNRTRGTTHMPLCGLSCRELSQRRLRIRRGQVMAQRSNGNLQSIRGQAAT